MATTDAIDTLIIGGGCAGLSLASRLAAGENKNNSNKPDVLVIEPRTTYSNDRTWCFWQKNKHPLAHKTWSAWTFSDSTEHLTQQTNQQQYQCLRAIDFYQSAVEAINKDAHVTLSLGHRVKQIKALNDGFVVHTNKGNIQAQNIIDTRPPTDLMTDQVRLLQSFKGIEIKTEQPLFKPNKVSLMTDMGHDQHGFYFTYVLPFSNSHALIEPTRFHLPGLTEDVLKSDLQNSLKNIIGDLPYNIIRTEHGVIPMGLKPAPVEFKNYVMAGTAGGAVRASSGYAFTRIQQWAEQCSQQILAGQSAHPHQADGWIYRHMDALFLETIKTNPEITPQLFMVMAKGLSADGLVRFLTNQARFLDFFKLIKALPARPFLSQIKNQLSNGLKKADPSASTCK